MHCLKAFAFAFTDLWGFYYFNLIRESTWFYAVPNVESQHKDERDAGEVLVHVESQGLEHLPDEKDHSDIDR
jgi:hypothetical protein